MRTRPVTLILATGFFLIFGGATVIVMAVASSAAVTPSPSAAPTASGTASPTPSPTWRSTGHHHRPSPVPITPSPSATGRMTPHQAATPAVTVSASATSVPPGGTILFRVSASAASPEAATVVSTLTPSATGPMFSPPVFTVAGCTCHPARTSYELTLPAGPPAAPQVEAQVSVPKSAPAGEKIQFSATVYVSNGTASPLAATGRAPAVTVATAPASPSPASSPKSAAGSSAGPRTGGPRTGGPAATAPSALGTSSGVGAPLPDDAGSPLAGSVGAAPLPIGVLPTIGSAASASTINVPAGSAANLFPQINPSSTPSQAPKPGRAAPSGQDAVAVAETSPISLTGAQLGSQLVGLFVLLLGVAVVATGVSVRKARAVGKPAT
ncbi:MAG TPA: hypothetical protein VGI96_00265 [Streptosporangiaceae bacterium]